MAALLRRRAFIARTGFALTVALGLGGCDDSTTPLPPPAEPVPAALQIRGLPEGPLPVGMRVQLTAWATFNDGSSGQVDAVWQSTDPAVATMDPSGNLLARGEGETRITAVFGPVRSEAVVSVTPPTVALYNLTGRVVNQNGKPVAAVLLVALDGAAAGQETRTGWDGRYFLPELQGETTIAARKDGYEEQRQRAMGPPGDLDFTLVSRAPRDSFGSGQWLVGDEIVPGRYYGTPQDGCLWQRRSDFPAAGGLGRAAVSPPDTGFIAERYFSFDARQEIVDIDGDDILFRVTPECGNWGPEPPVREIQTTIGAGSWLVGSQIVPGTYRTRADEFCYWARVQSFGGTQREILADNFLQAAAETTVTIEESDAGFFSDAACGPWIRVDERP